MRKCFQNYHINHSEQDSQFPTSPLIPGVKRRLNFPYVQGLQSLQKGYAFGSTMKDAHV